MSEETTTIQVSIENWEWLNSQKRPGESFDDVLDRFREPDDIEPATIPHDLDLPGSGETYERRRRAIAKLYTHLQEEGTATRADFLDLIDPSEVDYASGASFWSNCVKGRDSLSALEGVQPPEEGEHTWRYQPE